MIRYIVEKTDTCPEGSVVGRTYYSFDSSEDLEKFYWKHVGINYSGLRVMVEVRQEGNKISPVNKRS